MKILETERLILRGWQLEDLDDFFEYAKNPNVYNTMTGWEPHLSKEASLNALKSFIENDETWAIVLNESGKVIGQIKIYPDKNRGQYSARNSAKFINCALSEDYWGKGYMTEAVKRIVKYAFDEMSIDLLTAFHHPDNISSKRIIEKCGFKYEVTLEQGIKNYDGQFFQGVYHSILKSDYYKDNKMNIEIKKLTPDLSEDYAQFFDVTPHDVNIDEQKCYCVTWRSDDSYAHGEAHWFPTREERRKHAIEFVRDGSLQGYLAYCRDKIVGWCNANADCQACVNYLRSYWPIEQYSEVIKVKSIFCFMIAPEMQRKGVATALVERVCKDAADEGFDYVEAYINKEFIEADHDFRGPLEMYKKCGFDIYAEREGRVVVRKALKLL